MSLNPGAVFITSVSCNCGTCDIHATCRDGMGGGIRTISVRPGVTRRARPSHLTCLTTPLYRPDTWRGNAYSCLCRGPPGMGRGVVDWPRGGGWDMLCGIDVTRARC